MKSRVLFSSDPEIEGIVARIPVFQEREREEKLLSFYSDLQLNYNYFWKCCKPDGYMKIRTASEIVYALYRLVLQENRGVVPRLTAGWRIRVAGVENKPEGLVENCREFCETMDSELLDRIVESYHKWTSYDYPKDNNICSSQYGMDFENGGFIQAVDWGMVSRGDMSGCGVKIQG